ncbi:MAG: aminotransferase class I/II-fold pyridoxal phosphate-dependent enzyme, partial [Boseongicola sp.]
RAMVLVTPNNPTGAEYPSHTVRAFFELCQETGITLIVDETYRDFHSGIGAPHDLFCDPAWKDSLIHLYSFSKAYRLTGHRVGAMIAAPERLAQTEKFLDTVSICPNQLGQMAALWGMRNLRQWLNGERAEILGRRSAIETELRNLKDWETLCAGAYFAYVRHPFTERSDKLAKRLVCDAGILALPGTMFTPDDDPIGTECLRIAFANIDKSGIRALAERLASLGS